MTNKKNDKTNGEEARISAPVARVTSSDDPRLTAYALGELEAADVAAVESYLETSPEGRGLVEETRAFAGVLSEELAGEAAPRLAPEQRATLTAALGGQPGVHPVNGRQGGLRKGSRGAVLRLWLTSAAAVVLGVLGWKFATGGRPSVDDHALRPESSVARLDERASGAQLGKNEGDLEEGARGLRVSFGAGRRIGEDAPADESAPARLDAERLKSLMTLGYTDGGTEQGPDAEVADQLRALGYSRSGGDRSSSSTPSEVSGEDYVLEMYDVRDLVGRPVHQPTHDYNLLPSGTGEQSIAKVTAAAAEDDTLRGYYEANGQLVNPLPNSTAFPGSAPAAAEPSSAPATTPEQRHQLEALGYLDGSVADADDDRYGVELMRFRQNTSGAGGESYAPIHENPFQPLTQDRYSALSTFGIDVDTASYSNARRFLNRNQAPPPDAVRLEEFINAFDYDLPAPQGEHPFSVSVDAATAPWAPRHRLVRIGLKGMEFDVGERPASNLVFLLDVSGSMKDQDKLPLLVASLKMLVAELDEEDRVAIVTYASGSRLALPSTSGADKGTILAALDSLAANGSTNASDGIQNAYRVALENFVEGGTNRVLLATDGDFNVGITENGPLETFIADKARSGVFLTVLGFGTGNLKDSKAELLADRGNGNYAYIDTLNEAHKVLVREMSGTLVTIAKDVKLQVEFNPGRVAAYRLLGYENRALAAQDFRDDKKDAGEIGAGHTVTALYEVVPVGAESLPGAVELKYQAAPPEPEVVVDSPELLTVNLRYKLPNEDTAHEFAVPFVDGEAAFASASEDFRFAAAVASFGMVLRHSAYRGDVDLATIYAWAAASLGEDPHGDRAEFLRLVRNAQGLPGY